MLSGLTAAEIRALIAALTSARDVDGDGDFDANDSFAIHLVKLSGTDAQIDQAKGSSSQTAAEIHSRVEALAQPSSGSALQSSSQAGPSESQFRQAVNVHAKPGCRSGVASLLNPSSLDSVMAMAPGM